MTQAETIDRVLAGIRILPVVVVDSADQGLRLAEALLEGGIRGMEVTLRTPAGIEAVRAIAKQFPGVVIGTGTCTTPDDLARSRDAGAVFAVSPGLTPKLAEAAQAYSHDCPLLPGTASASEVMLALEAGFERLKFFPAENIGGIGAIKSIGGPLPQAKFCATGGIDQARAETYLATPNVFAVGGSWLTPKDKMAAGDWAAITELARGSAAL